MSAASTYPVRFVASVGLRAAFLAQRQTQDGICAAADLEEIQSVVLKPSTRSELAITQLGFGGHTYTQGHGQRCRQ